MSDSNDICFYSAELSLDVLMDYSDYGDQIATAVVNTFNKLNCKSGKPITRSNGVKEWTVLASIVALDGPDIIPISIATGVKALPDKVRGYSKGLIVHDMHAEVLALRCFNYFLLEQCQKDTKYLIKNGEKFKWNDNIKLALYVSEPPCGDASMGYLALKAADRTPWKDENEGKRRKTNIRGRAHFDKLGIVRTKPGRLDSIETLSKSCSDKICLKQLVGINNSISSLIIEPIYLDFLVLREDKFDKEDLKRCFDSRFPVEGAHKLEFISYQKDDYPFHKKKDYSPSPLSIIYIVESKHLQVLNNGVKNGSFIKNKPPKPGGQSFICNSAFYKLYKETAELEDNQPTDYQQLKQINVERNQLKQLGKTTLKHWINTTKDNFQLE